MTRPFAICVLSAALLLPAAGAAQRGTPRAQGQPAPEIDRGDVPHTPIRIDGNGFVLPEGEVAVSELIDASARFLGRNIMWSSEELQAVGGDSSFYLQKKIVVDALGCEELLYGLLFSKGLAVLPIDANKGFYEVVAMNGRRRPELAARATPRTAEEVLRRPNFREVVLVTAQLDNINAQHASNSLRPFFSQSGNQPYSLSIGTAGSNRSLVLQGFGDQVAGALRLLRECDVPQTPDPQTENLLAQLQSLQQAVAELQKRVQALSGGRERN